METIRAAIEYYISLVGICFPECEIITQGLIGYLFVIFICVLVVCGFYAHVLNEAEKWIHNGCVTSVSDRVTKR